MIHKWTTHQTPDEPTIKISLLNNYYVADETSEVKYTDGWLCLACGYVNPYCKNNQNTKNICGRSCTNKSCDQPDWEISHSKSMFEKYSFCYECWVTRERYVQVSFQHEKIQNIDDKHIHS